MVENSQGPGLVGVEPDTLARQGSLYHVRLSGDLTPAWIRSYLSLWAGLAFFSRFDLDIARHEISFPAPGEPDAVDTASLLQIVNAMLRLTTRRTLAA
jgi:hypothetical protein